MEVVARGACVERAGETGLTLARAPLAKSVRGDVLALGDVGLIGLSVVDLEDAAWCVARTNQQRLVEAA